MLDDLQLIKLAKEGRLEAFEALMSKYKDRVYNIAFSFTANHSESDDISQNIFTKAYFNLKSFEEKAAFSTWLYRIAVNECYNGLKKRKNNILSLDVQICGGENASLKDTIEDKSVNVEDTALLKAMQLKIRKAILELPDKYRMIVTLRDIEDISYEEISEIMKISQNKVKVWLFRARTKLKDKLKNI
ncbi:MAG: sigma-70 family RNA polymerase sigma factor [Endomicrobia bacterium]|nr:sigma-70 family RNA polymerase sigma factor [Bacillota bacterium]MCL1971846.1 sigma-70 family RNA polymerase sigma factor [Endomicrobiia bacterium]